MDRLALRFGERVTFRYVGPVPPYNFVEVRADWLARALRCWPPCSVSR